MLAHAVEAATFFDHGAAINANHFAIRVHALEILLGFRIVWTLVFREDEATVYVDVVHVRCRENLSVIEHTLRRERERIDLGGFVMFLEPAFDELLGFGQNRVVGGTLVVRHAHDDSIFFDKACHVIDVAVRVVAVQSVREYEHFLEAKSLAKSLHNFLQVLFIVAVLADEAIFGRNAKTVTVDFNSAAFEDERNAFVEREFLLFGNLLRDGVVESPWRELGAPSVELRFRDDLLVALLHKERTVVANPDVVCLDDDEVHRERAIGESRLFFVSQKVLGREQQVHRLEFRDVTDKFYIELADVDAAFTIPVRLVVRES